jgi:large subunit ribosomal protein L15
MRLHELSPAKGARKAKKRIGRGVGSGWGKTAGRGSKGQNSRSGGGIRPGFEGGQMPIQRRLPKRGFKNVFAKSLVTINVRDLTRFESGSTVDEQQLASLGIVKGKRDGIKLLGQGSIDYPVNVKVNAVSRSAREKIEAAGGKVEVTE